MTQALSELAGLSKAAVGAGTTQALLERYIRAAVASTSALRGFLALAETETGDLELVATAGEGWTEATRKNRLAVRERTSTTITSRVAATGASVRVGDILQEEPEYTPYFATVRAVLATPIALEPEERVRGVLNLESDRVGAFTAEHEAFATTLSGLAALRLAMDDLRAREAALVQIGQELSGSPDVDAEGMLDRILAITGDVLRSEECALFFFDPAARRLMLAAARGKRSGTPDSYALGEGTTGMVAQTGRTVRVRDQYRAFLAAPIKSVGGIVGVLRVIRRESRSPWFPNDFTAADEEVLSTIAAQVGAAVDNARLFARLMQSERMAAWGEMSAMSSHMIGNRVFAIKGDLNELEHILEQGPAEATLAHLKRGEVTALVEGMKRGIFRLEELLAEFRDFVRAGHLAPVENDATEITQTVVRETFPKRSKVGLIERYADEPLPVSADPVKLKRAFSELIENAVTFLEERGGALTVATRRLSAEEPLPARMVLPRPSEAGYALITFEDNGPGVAESEKERIFRPFVTSRTRGMGLGLAIVKGIVEAHHGAIVETGTPGQGARFAIVLPLRRETEALRREETGR